MKTKNEALQQGLRTIVQKSLLREASEPCQIIWSYQPHRPKAPLPQPKDKK